MCDAHSCHARTDKEGVACNVRRVMQSSHQHRLDSTRAGLQIGGLQFIAHRAVATACIPSGAFLSKESVGRARVCFQSACLENHSALFVCRACDSTVHGSLGSKPGACCLGLDCVRVAGKGCTQVVH